MATMPEGTDSIIDDNGTSPEILEEMERTSIPMDDDAEKLGMGAAGEASGSSAPKSGDQGGNNSSGTFSAADAKETIADAKAQAGDKVNDLKGQATDKIRTLFDSGKGRATESINNVVKLIEDSAQTVDDKVGSQYGDYARQAASMLSGFATKIDEQDVDALLDTARDTVRKSPALAIGAAAAIGFVLARVVKSGIDVASAAVDQAADDKKA